MKVACRWDDCDEEALGDLYLVNAAGGAPRLVAKGVDGEPSWSPDGTRVLAAALMPGTAYTDDVLSYPIAGGEPLNLTRTSNWDEWEPRSSPDGKWVAYLYDGVELRVVPATGGRARHVTSADVSFTWSPDSRRLAIPTPYGISVVPALGGRKRALGTGPVNAGGVSAWGAGGRLLYEVTCRAQPDCVGYGHLPVTYLWTGTKDEKIGEVDDAQFLPDGTVAFLDDLDGRGIGFLKPDNTLRKVGPLPEDGGTSAAWSTDGRYLAFASFVTGHVYVARADGSGARRLPLNFHHRRNIYVLGWQPHGAGRRP